MFSSKKFLAQAKNPAYFRVGDKAAGIGTAAFFVRIEDQNTINQARRILAGLEPPLNVGGTIVKSSTCWNPGWSYHYDPGSVYLFEVAVEVCDAAYWYVEENLEYVGGAFLPGNDHCNWGSFLIEEVDGSCPRPTITEGGINAYCCEVPDSYSAISNTRKVDVKFSASIGGWADVEVDYGDGNGWVGFKTVRLSEGTNSIEAPLLPGVGYQRYRVRITWNDLNPDYGEYTPWSYTNPVMQFTANTPTNNPVC